MIANKKLLKCYFLPVLHRQAMLHGLIWAIVSKRTQPRLQALWIYLVLVLHADHAEVRSLIRQYPCEVFQDGNASQQQNLECSVRL